MRPWTLTGISVIFPALLLAASSSATDLYKWVDENGVTNYSSEPPAARTAKKLTGLEGRVSVYSPDKLLLQAVEASRQKALDDVRTGRYERQLEADYQARLRAAPAWSVEPQGYDPCLDAANVDLCNNRLYSGFPYGGVPGVFAGRRSRFVPQIQIPPGTTAGNVVGLNGFMPGQSAFSPGGVPPTVTAPHPEVSTAHSGRRR